MDTIGKVLSLASSKILIGVFGLSEYELRLVRSVLSLTATSGRAHSYALLDPASGGCPDIAILDPGDAQAGAALDALAIRSNLPRPPTLFISYTQPAEQGKHYLLRPLAPTRMLALLDQIAGKIVRALPAAASNPVPVPTPAALPAAANQTLAVPPAAIHSDAHNVLTRPAYRALIIDDSPTVRIKIDLELRPMNIAADCAETGEQGLHMLAQKSYDIIFLDIVLPGADGYEVCKAIRHNQDTKRIPVVMLTSKSSPFDRIRGSLAGCTNYLVKPVECAKFQAVIEKCLSASEAQHALDGHQRSVVAA